MKNGDFNRLHDMLARATAPPDAASDALDAEAASLREGWLGLCRLIEEEGQGASGTEQARRSLRSSVPVVPCSLPHAKPTAWSPWMIAAVAASVLIGVSMTMLVRYFIGAGGGQPQAQQFAHDATSSKNPRIGSAARHSTSSPEDVAGSLRLNAGDRQQWGDSVDDEITAVSQATLLAQQDWYAQSSRIGAVQSGLDELESEMAQGKP